MRDINIFRKKLYNFVKFLNKKFILNEDIWTTYILQYNIYVRVSHTYIVYLL